MSNENLNNYLTEPVIVGLVGGAITYMMYKNKSINVGGKSIPIYQLNAVGIAGGKMLDNALSQYVFPQVTRDSTRPLNAPMTELISIGTIAGSSALLHYYNDKKSLASLLPAIGLEAAAAEIIGISFS